MTVFIDTVTAVPSAAGSPLDKSVFRPALVKRVAYCLDDSENLSTITVVDPSYGTIPLYVIQQRRLFQYDSTDSTTSADGVTVLVSADGKRYKIDDWLLPFSVKSKTATPPGSPANGDAYIVGVGATGAWAGKDNKLTKFTTSRSWVFNDSPEGRPIYNEADGSYYFRDQTGTWIKGVGNLPLASSIVSLSSIIGTGASLTTRIINQTTNTPPGSPAVGDAYIIGPVPTGAWTSNVAKVAICESGSTFTIYTPKDGDRVYDIALKQWYQWSSASSTWITSGGNMQLIRHVYAASTTFTHDPRCILVDVTCIGGGGGAGPTSTGGVASSFGAHNSATGGAADSTTGFHLGGASGVGSGGDVNGKGVPGSILNDGTNDRIASFASLPTEWGAFFGGVSGSTSALSCGGPPGISRKVMLLASLLTTETITVGGGGTNGGSNNVLTPSGGMIVVDEWVLA